jgi:hypothetical protein
MGFLSVSLSTSSHSFPFDVFQGSQTIFFQLLDGHQEKIAGEDPEFIKISRILFLVNRLAQWSFGEIFRPDDLMERAAPFSFDSC